MTRSPALLASAAAALLALGSLAGCGRHHDDNVATDTASISFSTAEDAAANGTGGGQGAGGGNQTVSLTTPGFSAKLSVPGISLGAQNTEIDGIRFHPGTRITAMNVTGKAGDGSGGEGHGVVELRFADPAAPDALLAYYRDAAGKAGWTVVPPAGGEQFAATKPDKQGSERLGLSLTPRGAGSTGHFIVTSS